MRIRPAAVVLAVALVVLAGAGWSIAQEREVRGPVAAGSLTSLRAPTPDPAAPDPAAPDRVAPDRVAPDRAAPDPAPRLGTVTARPAGVDRFAPAPVPVRVTIPALGVDAPVVPVGVAPDQSLEVPESPSTVGWYRPGPAPGAPGGSSVLASHVDSATEGAGVFFRITELAPGAEIAVARSDGSTLAYEVLALRQFPKDELPRHDLFTATGPHRITLLTCGGEFDPERRTYRDNVVVIAVPSPTGTEP